MIMSKKVRCCLRWEIQTSLLAEAAPHVIHGKRLIVVMPAYNAASTVEKKVADIPSGYVDEIILVDDLSRNHKFEIAKKMGLHAIRHPQNRGYGGNPRIWYQEAPKLGASVVVMLNRDCRYTPKFVV